MPGITIPLLRDTDNGATEETKTGAGAGPESRSSSKSWLRRVFLVFGLACMFSQYLLVSYLAPFLPVFAEAHGISSGLVGLIMASNSFATCVAAPIVGFKMDAMGGMRNLLMAGLFLSGTTLIVLAFIPKIFSDGSAMAAAFIATRLSMGVAGALVETSIYGQLIREFSESRGTVMAASEICIGLGMLVGPPFGGMMYQLGESFALPSLVFAGFPFVLLIAARPLLPATPTIGGQPEDGEGTAVANGDAILQDTSSASPPSPGNEQEDSDFIGAVLSLPFGATFVGTVLSAASMGFLQPLLAPYLADTYGLSSGLAGVFFMIPSVTYILISMFAGLLVDHFGGHSAPLQQYHLKMMSAVGFALLSVSYLFFAPVFARDTLEHYYVLAPALAVVGLGVGLTTLPTIADMQSIAERHLCKLGQADERLSDKVSGVWGCAYFFGSGLGPVVGGALESAVGNNWSAFIFACVCVAGGVVSLAGAMRARNDNSGKSVPQRE